MFNETQPQDYLNDMHAIGIPKLFHPRMNPRDRASGIRNAKQELNRLKLELQHHRDTIRSKSKSLPSDEVKRILAPFNLLQNLIQQLTEEVTGLEDKLSKGKMLPHTFEFGAYIFGDEELGEWFIGDEEHYADWQEADDVKQRLNGFKREGKPHLDKLTQIHGEYESRKTDYHKAQAKLDRLHKKSYIIVRIFLLLVLTIGSAAGGAYLYLELSNELLGLIGFGLAGFFFLVIPFGYRDWRKRNRKLISHIREQKTQMRRLQMEGKEVKKRYRPIEFQIKALTSQYQRLRSNLRGGNQVSSVA